MPPLTEDVCVFMLMKTYPLKADVGELGAQICCFTDAEHERTTVILPEDQTTIRGGKR
jgi:hypothetical protein